MNVWQHLFTPISLFRLLMHLLLALCWFDSVVPSEKWSVLDSFRARKSTRAPIYSYISESHFAAGCLIKVRGVSTVSDYAIQLIVLPMQRYWQQNMTLVSPGWFPICPHHPPTTPNLRICLSLCTNLHDALIFSASYVFFLSPPPLWQLPPMGSNSFITSLSELSLSLSLLTSPFRLLIRWAVTVVRMIKFQSGVALWPARSLPGAAQWWILVQANPPSPHLHREVQRVLFTLSVPSPSPPNRAWWEI